MSDEFGNPPENFPTGQNPGGQGQGLPPQDLPPQQPPQQQPPQQGAPAQGFPPQSFPPQGYPQQGAPQQGFPPQGGPMQSAPGQYPGQAENKKVLSGILALILGGFGVHKFMLGYTTEGLIQLAATFLTCGLAGIIPIVEGIIYLTKSDEEFYYTYQVNKKGWF